EWRSVDGGTWQRPSSPGEEALLPQRVQEHVDVPARGRLIGVECRAQARNELLPRRSLRETGPEGGRGPVEGEVGRAAQVEPDYLSLDLAPFEALLPETVGHHGAHAVGAYASRLGESTRPSVTE